MALEAKDDGRLLRFRRHEFKIVRTLHADFGRLDLHTAHCASATECDICRLVRAAKRMTLSEYADEFTAFIRETREAKGGTATRVTHDFTGDFRRYIMRTGLPEHSKARQLMARAELVSQYLSMQMNDAKAQPGNIAPACIRVVAANQGLFLEERQNKSSFGNIRHRVAVIFNAHLRILQPGSS